MPKMFFLGLTDLSKTGYSKDNEKAGGQVFMKIPKIFSYTAVLLVFLGSISTSAYCCVGRILTVAIDNSVDQKVVGTVLAIFINERTGTTVDLIPCKDISSCKDMVKNGDADIFIDYIGQASLEIGDASKASSPQEIYSLVKQYFLHNYSMVWLKPFGYHGPLGTLPKPGFGQGSLAAPVTSSRVLDQFPILDRVINKLSGKLDDECLKKLVQDSKAGDNETVIKKFLRDRNLI